MKKFHELQKKGCCGQFKAIIMDYDMPVMNGVQATKTLKNMGCTCKIIGHTAFSNSTDVKNCLDAGMDIVLEKPCKKKELLDHLKLL